jgi:hypothetical protein
MTDREPKDGTMPDKRTAESALDRLLALRNEDLEGWEEALAATLAPDLREAAESVDLEFEALLSSWIDAERAAPAPDITARDILALDQRVLRTTEAAPAADSEVVRIRRVRRPDHTAVRRQTAALVAALALVAVGSWIVAFQVPATLDLGSRTKALVTSEATTRLDLQFSVERGTGEDVVVAPGTDGASYGPDAHLAIRLDVQGEGGWLALLEVDPSGESRLLYPTDGEALRLDAGSHPLVGSGGEPLVYRPDPGVTGTRRYIALLTREPIDPMRVAPGVLSAGVDRADLWPRPVLAVDDFTVDWR